VNEQEILSAIDESPDGEIDEQVLFASAPSGNGAVRLTNVLTKLRAEGSVERVRREGGLRVYRRVAGNGGGE
jgi:hypothetical protein